MGISIHHHCPGNYLLVWASGKERRDSPCRRYHTNFKLNPNGDTLQMFGPELPRTLVDELKYPEQSPNHAYGRQGAGAAATWRYFVQATPGAANGLSTITGKVDQVHFSVEREFFRRALLVQPSSCKTADAQIRNAQRQPANADERAGIYGADSDQHDTGRARGGVCSQPIAVGRADPHLLAEPCQQPLLLPVLSLVTGTNNLYGRTGIMESNPRNTTKHGAAWERPVSAEWIRPGDNGGFQTGCGPAGGRR